MKSHVVLLGVFEGPAPPPFGLKEAAVGPMLPKAVTHHLLDLPRRCQKLGQRHLGHEIDVVVRLDAVSDRAHDGPEPEGALRIDPGLDEASGIVAIFEPVPYGDIPGHRVTILARRYVDLARDQLQKLAVPVQLNGHWRKPLAVGRGKAPAGTPVRRHLPERERRRGRGPGSGLVRESDRAP